MDWLVFVTHEDSLLFAGDWLVAEIKKIWPEWRQGLWCVAEEERRREELERSGT